MTLEALRASTEPGQGGPMSPPRAAGDASTASGAAAGADVGSNGTRGAATTAAGASAPAAADGTPGSSSTASCTLWGQMAQSADVYGHIQEATRKGVEAAVAVMRSPARHEQAPAQAQPPRTSSSLWALAADTESQVCARVPKIGSGQT